MRLRHLPMGCLARVIDGNDDRRYVARLRHPTLKRAVAQFLTPEDLEDENDPVWTVEWWPGWPPGNDVVKVVADNLKTVEDVRAAMRVCETGCAVPDDEVKEGFRPKWLDGGLL